MASPTPIGVALMAHFLEFLPPDYVRGTVLGLHVGLNMALADPEFASLISRAISEESGADHAEAEAEGRDVIALLRPIL